MKCYNSGLTVNTNWLPRRPSACSSTPSCIGRGYRQLANATSHLVVFDAHYPTYIPKRGKASFHKSSKNLSRYSRLVNGISKQLDSDPSAFRHGLKKFFREKLREEQDNTHPGWGKAFIGDAPPGFRKMKSFIQFLTTPTVDTYGTALMLHFDEKRYIIGNIHEGLQRAVIQSGSRMAKVTDVFITGKTEWKSVGGLFGVVLTLADAAAEARAALREAYRRQLLRRGQGTGEADSGALAANYPPKITTPALNVHGGPNLMHLFATARKFLFRKGMPIKILEYEEAPVEQGIQERKPDWVDDCIQVWTLAINPSLGGTTAGPTTYPTFDSLFETEQSIKAKEKADQKTRRDVVSEMFESSWRLDQLEERRLSQVLEENPHATTFIRNPDTNKLERYYPPVSDVPDITVITRKAWPGALVQTLPPSRPSPTAFSYIIRNHWQRGRFLPEKAKQLNVNPGPHFNELTRGKSVQAMDGNTVTPEMVLAEGKEGGGVAVVDLPSIDYVEGLITRPEWKFTNVMTGVGAILWLLGPGVSKDQRLQDFIRDRPNLAHVVSSPDDCPNYLAFDSSAASAIRHNQVGARYFPLPSYNNLPTSQASPTDSRLEIARRGQIFQLEPRFENKSNAIVPFLNTAEVLEATPNRVLNLARVARQEIERVGSEEVEGSHILPSEDAEIALLGTGSSAPSKYRNVAGNLLRVPGCGSYLLDCGENTLGQMKRIYGPETFREILRDLRLIWISHLHADHHLGTASVIKAWYEEIYGGNPGGENPSSILHEFQNPAKILEEERRLVIVGPIDMVQWLKEYANVEDYGYSKIVPLQSLCVRNEYSFLQWHDRAIKMRDGPGFPSSRLGEALRKATGLTDLNACLVSHCIGAQAVSLTFATGFKFSYSGDCRPSKTFAEIGRNSTVLLHEATFDDELQADAEAKKHSTMSEAINVGLAMRAKRVILTHFSQRYQKLPVMAAVDTKLVKLEEEEIEEPGLPLDEAITDAAGGIAIEGSLDGAEAANGANVESSMDSSFTQQQSIQAETQAFLPSVASAPSLKVGSTSAPERRIPSRSSSRSPSAQKRSQSRHKTSAVSIPASAAKEMRICVAFDYMKLKVKEIEHIEKLTPALRELYKAGDIEERAASAAAAAEHEKNYNAKRKKHQKKSNDENSDKKAKRQDGNDRPRINHRSFTKSGQGNLVDREEADQGHLTPQLSTISK